MADSDNTTSLPFVTCRRKGQIAVVDRARPAEPAAVRNICEGKEPDPVLMLALNWRDAHARTLALCRRQQRLENRLARSFDFPSTTEPPNRTEMTTDAAAVHSARWRQKDFDLGYSKTKNAETRAAEAAEVILEALARTPAQSLDGVIAKLEVLVEEGKTHDGATSFPWPQLRSAMDDLKRLIDQEHRSSSQRRA